MMEKIKRFKFSILWSIIMLIGCTAKLGDELPKEPMIPYQDKIVHFAIFGIMGFIMIAEKRKTDCNTLIICTLYGILIEIIQSFLPWRSFEILDMVFDSLGAVAGIIAAKYLLKNRIN